MTQVPPMRALIDSKQSSWVSVSHGPTQEKDPSTGTTGIHALTGVAVVAATSEDASREKPRSKRFDGILKGYKRELALGKGIVQCGKQIPVLVPWLRAYVVEGIYGVVDIKPAELGKTSRFGHGLGVARRQPKCSQPSAVG